MITIKQLAPYLPYKVKIQIETTDIRYETMIGIAPNDDDKYFKIQGDKFDLINELSWGLNCYCKPVLRPLSDLSKKIKHNNETLIPTRVLELRLGINDEYFGWDDHKTLLEWLSYDAVKLLLEWHFDIFGLIPEGLAVDMNTIKEH